MVVCDLGDVQQTIGSWQDLDECTQGTHACSSDEACQNEDGTYTCGGCAPGYVDSGESCVDFDECAEGAHVCADFDDCLNLNGAYTCRSHYVVTGTSWEVMGVPAGTG